MFLQPMRYESASTKRKVVEFHGYNTKSVIEDGEMREMYNLSSDEFPCLYQRKPRGIFSESYEDPMRLLVKDKKLAVISGGRFFYDGKEYPQLVLSDQTQMVAINTKICFFPEKKFFNVKDIVVGNLEAEVTGGATFTISTLSMDGCDKFREGDCVKIEGCTVKVNEVSAIVQKAEAGKLTFPKDTFTVSGDSYNEENITISRKVPNLDFVMESNNRLWGVSNADNTVYSCKSGDPTNWFYYQNTSLDAYAVGVGTDGEWTGCIPYASHLLFFKEDYIHKVYGSKPSNYQIVTAECHALEKGSHESIKVINEMVLYKSRLGIMAYAGSVPELISSNFGTTRYRNAVAGTDGIKYYISMESEGRSYLFVYDVQKALWHKEDNTRVRDFAYYNGKLLYINDGDRKIYEIESENPMPEERDVRWVAMLGPYDEYAEEKKIYSRINMRMKMAEESEITVSVNIDNCGWEKLNHINAEQARSVFLPVVPRRCNKFAIKLEGKGYCRIESVVREYREGSGV